MKIYVICGRSGFFEDFRWNVQAFTNLSDADKLLSKLRSTIDEYLGDGLELDSGDYINGLYASLSHLDPKL